MIRSPFEIHLVGKVAAKVTNYPSPCPTCAQVSIECSSPWLGHTPWRRSCPICMLWHACIVHNIGEHMLCTYVFPKYPKNPVSLVMGKTLSAFSLLSSFLCTKKPSTYVYEFLCFCPLRWERMRMSHTWLRESFVAIWSFLQFFNHWTVCRFSPPMTASLFSERRECFTISFCELSFARSLNVVNVVARKRSIDGVVSDPAAMGNVLSASIPTQILPVEAYVCDISEMQFVQRYSSFNETCWSSISSLGIIMWMRYA